MDTPPASPDSQLRTGLWYALLAYGLWGGLPLFWKLLAHVSAAQQLLHRVLWGGVVLLGLVLALGRIAPVRAALADPGARRRLAASSAVLAVNWFVFLYAVETDRVLHASLGYYLNPIVSVVLGMVVLGERLRGLQQAAVVCAVLGVLALLWRAGELPWIGLTLAAAFGSYGLLRKTTAVDSLTGNTVEAGMMSLVCIVALVWVELVSGTGSFVRVGASTTALLLAAGLVTAVPLLCFTAAAQRLPLFALGFMQYLTPTSHFLLAVYVFGEPFGSAHALAFAAIWTGVGLFALDLAIHTRNRSPRGRAPGSGRGADAKTSPRGRAPGSGRGADG